MSLDNLDYRVMYDIGETPATRFPFHFPAMSKEDIHVYDVDPGLPDTNPEHRKEITDFTIDLVGGNIRDGGDVVLGNPGSIPAGHRLEIIRMTPLTQESVYTSQMRINPAVLENSFDKLHMIAVEQQSGGSSGGTSGDITIESVTGLQEALNSKVSTSDSRLADARTPTKHAATHAMAGIDRIRPADIEALGFAPSDGNKYLVSGGVFVKYVPSEGGGGGGGTLDHSDLTEESRSLPNQHPQSAIQYLESDLAAKADLADMTAKLNAKANANHSHADATDSKAGFMSAMDKAKLDGMGSGVYVGEIRLLPYRASQLPTGWYFANGDLFPLASGQGGALNGLSAEYKTDWGIAINGANINLPKLFYSDGRGFFLRAGTTPGVVQNDAIRNITGTTGGTYVLSNSNATSLVGALQVGNVTSVPLNYTGSNAYWNQISLDASRQVATAAENRPVNVTMTPAIFLGV